MEKTPYNAQRLAELKQQLKAIAKEVGDMDKACGIFVIGETTQEGEITISQHILGKGVFVAGVIDSLCEEIGVPSPLQKAVEAGLMSRKRAM